ncbi:Ig-like domain-containing protein, partial [Patescibacteria group bacterium]
DIEAPCNLPPVAVDDEDTTPYNTPVEVDVLENDYDRDGDLDVSSLEVRLAWLPDDGSVDVNNDSGVITYTPNHGFHGLDTFTYQICDYGQDQDDPGDGDSDGQSPESQDGDSDSDGDSDGDSGCSGDSGSCGGEDPDPSCDVACDTAVVTITVNPPPPDEPECTLTEAPGRTIVNFSGDHIIARGSLDNASDGPVSVSLEQGRYSVTLMSFDYHAEDGDEVSEDSEGWYAILDDAAGEEIAVTDPIGDLPDDLNVKVQTVNADLIVPTDAAAVTAIHSAWHDNDDHDVIPVCAAFDLEDEPPPQVECPLSDIDGRIIVNFSGTPIIANEDLAAATDGPVSSSIPAGEYQVTLVSFDDHSNKPWQVQTQEQWYGLLKDASGSTVAMTSTISDLAEDEDWLTETVDGGLVLETTVTSMSAIHAAYPTTNENSVYAVCAAFDVVSPPEHPIRPILECVEHHAGGTYTALFGYHNENSYTATIAIGGHNKITPGQVDRGQPQEFDPGRHGDRDDPVFTVPFEGDETIHWTLKAPDNHHYTATASNDPSVKCPEPPWDNSNLIVAGQCTEDDFTVEFVITNTGEPVLGDMDGPVEYRIYRNGDIETSGTVQLEGGENTSVEVAAGTDIVSIQVDQRPMHPSGTPATDEATCPPVPPENDPPVAVDDYEIVGVNTAGTPTSVVIAVLDNDSDPNEDPIFLDSIVDGSGPEHGTLDVNYDTGTITYTPNEGYSGNDQFDYQICDDPPGSAVSLCDTATVYITVSPVAVDDEAWTVVDVPIDVAVLANDYDLDGVLVPDTVATVDGSFYSLPDHTGYGSAVVNPVTGVITYTPPAGYVGDVYFDYTVEDDDGLPARATVLIHIGYSPPPPPPGPSVNAYDDYACAEYDTETTIDVLANDSSPTGTLDVSSLTVTSQSDGAQVGFATNGDALYTPPSDTDSDEFTYQVCAYNNYGRTCREATVRIEVREICGPHPPVAVDDARDTQPSTPVTIDILANDYDVDGDLDRTSLTLLASDPPDNGSVVVIPGVFNVIYTPNPGFAGTDIFSYSICDLQPECDTAVVTVNITSPPPGSRRIPPVAVDDFATTPYETPVTIPVIAPNDFDPDGYLVYNTMRLVTPPTSGTVTAFTLTGEYTYTPNPGFTGTDKFTYEICDNDGMCDQAVVTVEVGGPSPIPPPPTPPPLIPPVVLPPLVTPVEVTVLTLDCGLPLALDDEMEFTGTFTGDLAEVTAIEYSLSDGLSWIPVDTVTPIATGATFAFTLSDLQANDYNVRARIVSADETAQASVSSNSCTFTVDLGLIFGANQFILGAQPSPMSDSGTIHFIVDQAHRFYLEARGATQAFVQAIDTELIFPLTWNRNLKLWTGMLSFAEPGFYR